MQEEKKYDREEIERLREIRDTHPEDLKPEEIKYANLHPIEKGEVRNPNGRTKGTKNWKTHFQKLMGDEKLLKSVISQLPKQWDGIVDEIPADVIAAGLITSVTQGVAKAVAEGKPIDKQTLEMIDRINKIGYGESKQVELGAEEGGFFDRVNFNFVSHSGRKPEEES